MNGIGSYNAVFVCHVNAEIHSRTERPLEPVRSQTLRLQHAMVQVDQRTASAVLLACKFYNFSQNTVILFPHQG